MAVDSFQQIMKQCIGREKDGKDQPKQMVYDKENIKTYKCINQINQIDIYNGVSLKQDE